ncbi:MAG: cobalamin B12-binding domain-containing protein [Anaerolineae bacterium]
MPTLVGAALGECVHVAGVLSFLRLAEAAGWRTVFLGPSVPVQDVIAAAQREGAEMVGVSYRLTPETGERLLGEFCEAADELRQAGVRFCFGGTPPMAKRAAALGFFERVFGEEGADEALAYLRGEDPAARTASGYPQTMLERLHWRAPYPLLRHHFGLPTMEATLDGIARIAEAGVLDCISLGTDQDAQAHFFHPERQDPARTGAGGVPVRSAEDFRALYAASRRGNHPLLRTYAGTDDLLALAELYVNTIHNAWSAVPLFWFNRLDGRGPWDLEPSIRLHQELMAWHGERGIPVESNEAHHWGLRDAPDVISVAVAFLAAYNARAFGVRDYIAPLMLNSPPALSEAMDLAKMLAMMDIIEPLSGPAFRIYRQTRTGLLSYPTAPEAARAHLCASVYLQMALKPHIVHVVGHTEAHHAATADDVIEACRMARRAIDNALHGQPNMTLDPAIAQRRNELVREAHVTLAALRRLAPPDVPDPYVDPPTLTRAVTSGLLDAPHLRNNPFARGQVMAARDERGAWVAVEAKTGRVLGERERLQLIIER